MEKIIKIFNAKFSYDRIIEFLISNMFYYILAIIIILFYSKIRNTIYKILYKVNRKIFSDDGVFSFFYSVSKFVLNIVLLVVILQLLGVQLKGVVALLGALSLVLGFAFKETFANIFSGLIILTFKPFKIDDAIQYKGYIGIVKKIELFYTTILNFQNEHIIIPNSELTNNEIRNITKSDERRLDLTIGVSYETNIEQVKSVIKEVIYARQEDLFVLDQDLIIGLADFAASSLNVDIKVYVQKGMYLTAKYYILETLKVKFDELGIEIPYNKLDLYIKDGEIK